MPRSLPYILRHLVDARTGIINRLSEVTSDPLAADLFVTVAEARPGSYFIHNAQVPWANSSPGSGAAFSREQALWAAAGETIERYCASIYDPSMFIHTSAKQLLGRTIDLSRHIGYSAKQTAMPAFPYSAYCDRVERDWAAGISLHDNEPVLAPAQMVFLSSQWTGGERIAPAVSTGVACHSDPERAIESALLELLERDSFSSAWLLRFAPPRLVVDREYEQKISSQTRAALSNPALPLTLQILRSQYGPVTVIATAESPVHGFGVVGAACRRDLPSAIEKAVIEALHGWSSAMSSKRLGEAIPESGSIRNPHDHALHYFSPENWSEARWFRSPDQSVSAWDIAPDSSLDFDSVLEGMAGDGIRASAYDLTTADAQALGFSVVRIIAPGLQPLMFGQSPIPDDWRRLEQNAFYWSVPFSGAINTQVHPFP